MNHNKYGAQRGTWTGILPYDAQSMGGISNEAVPMIR